MNTRQLAERVAFSHLSRPYIWGGDNPGEGFDCSGLAIEVYKSVGLLPRVGDWTAKQLLVRFLDSVTYSPGLMSLVFWGAPNAKHVELWIADDLSIGASGGGSSTRSVAAAIKQDAYVKIRPISGRGGQVVFADPFRGGG